MKERVHRSLGLRAVEKGGQENADDGKNEKAKTRWWRWRGRFCFCFLVGETCGWSGVKEGPHWSPRVRRAGPRVNKAPSACLWHLLDRGPRKGKILSNQETGHGLEWAWAKPGDGGFRAGGFLSIIWSLCFKEWESRKCFLSLKS